MITRRYNSKCHSCGNHKMKRIHRGFFKKYILRVDPVYYCPTCKATNN